MTEIDPGNILAFWRAAGAERWYKRDDGFDASVRERFFGLWQKARAGELSSWETTDDGALALVIVLDQFPRNMFRCTLEAFSSDVQAREIAHRAIACGVDKRIEPDLLEFLYLPFMHSEDLTDKLRCVYLFPAIHITNKLRYADEHADIIRQFGRFPHRNQILGRVTTPEEQAFLDG